MDTVKRDLEMYVPGDYRMTDDKAPVELLGMRVIDDLIADEVTYYKGIYEKRACRGFWMRCADGGKAAAVRQSECQRIAGCRLLGCNLQLWGEYTVITNGYDAAGNRNFTLENRLFIIKSLRQGVDGSSDSYQGQQTVFRKRGM